MRLKRLLIHFRKQDWTAFAIEFLIVVVGVFLGIQVSNWNEALAENSRAHAYLIRIHGDLDADIAASDRSIAYYDQTLTYARRALAYAENGELAGGSDWKTVLAFYQAGQIYPHAMSDATYREMTNAGDLRLIRDESLSAALAAYYSDRSVSAQELYNQLPAYRETIRGLTPSSVQTYIWASCYRQLNMADQVMIDCASPIPDTQAQAILRDFLSEPQTTRQLRFWVAQINIQRTVSTVERADAVGVAKQVTQALR